MRYGYFDDVAREYVIHRPDTPLPWINYLGQDDYYAMVSNTGGGYSFYRDARLRRLIRYRYNSAPADCGGRALYLRLADGDYWSPTWQPVRKPLESYECHHGLGYTRIVSAYRGVRAEVTYFVPLGQTIEVWRVKLVNQSPLPMDLQLFSLVEFCLWDAWDDQTNYQRNFNTGEVQVDAAAGVIYHITEYRERRIILLTLPVPCRSWALIHSAMRSSARIEACTSLGPCRRGYVKVLSRMAGRLSARIRWLSHLCRAWVKRLFLCWAMRKIRRMRNI